MVSLVLEREPPVVLDTFSASSRLERQRSPSHLSLQSAPTPLRRDVTMETPLSVRAKDFRFVSDGEMGIREGERTLQNISTESDSDPVLAARPRDSAKFRSCPGEHWLLFCTGICFASSLNVRVTFTSKILFSF